MSVPSWFKFETGFRFLDESGDECVVLGHAGYRKYDKEVSASFFDGEKKHSAIGFQMEMKKGMVFVYKYKGEWHLGDLFCADHDDRWWASIKKFDEK